MAPKAKEPVKKVFKSESDGIVLFCKDEILKSPEDSTPSALKLRHPQSNSGAMFLFSSDYSKIQEIQKFSEENRSWFIGENVRSNGDIHLSTPFNPVFLALPYLSKAERVSPLEQTILDKDYPDTKRLLNCLKPNLLSLICDQIGDEDLNCWKYNESKTMDWLKNKINKIVQILKDKKLNIDTSLAVSNTFVQSKTQESEENYIRYAHGLLSEYLSTDLSSKLLLHIGLTPIKPSDNKRKSNVLTPSKNNENENKKIKLENIGQEEISFDPPKIEKATPNKPIQLSAKDKALAKSASGTKPISSFFKKAAAK